MYSILGGKRKKGRGEKVRKKVENVKKINQCGLSGNFLTPDIAERWTFLAGGPHIVFSLIQWSLKIL
jgi:hypothetical protein